MTYLVNLDNFPISQRAHCRVPSFVFSCRVYRCVRVFVATLSLSFLFLISFFFCCWILLSFSLGQPSSSPFYTLQLSLAVASFTIRPISKEGQSKDSPSPLCVCPNNNLLDVFISSNLAALCTTNFLEFSVSSSPINRQGARSSINQTHPLSLSNFLSALTRFNQLCRINNVL